MARHEQIKLANPDIDKPLMLALRLSVIKAETERVSQLIDNLKGCADPRASLDQFDIAGTVAALREAARDLERLVVA